MIDQDFSKQEGSYAILIRNVLDAISFDSITARDQFISDVATKSLEELKSIPILERLEDLLDTDMGYFYPEHKEQFEDLLKKILALRIQEIKQEEVVNQKSTGETEVAAEVSSKKGSSTASSFVNGLFRRIRAKREDHKEPVMSRLSRAPALSTEQLVKIRELNNNHFTSVSFCTQQEEADLCIQAATLIAECFQHQELKEQNQQVPDDIIIVNKYISFMAQYLSFPEAKSKGLIENDQIQSLRTVLQNVLLTFNGSAITVLEYSKFHIDKQKLLLRAATNTILVQSRGSLNEDQIPGAFDVRDALDKESFILYLNAMYNKDCISYAMESRDIDGKKSSYEQYASDAAKKFLKDRFGIQCNESEGMIAELTKITAIFREILAQNSLSAEEFTNLGMEKLTYILENLECFYSIKNIGGNGVRPLLNLDIPVIKSLFENSSLVVKLCKSLAIKLDVLLSINNESLTAIFSSPVSADRIDVLIKYYGLTVEKLQSMPVQRLQQLLDAPHLAIEEFNVSAKPFATTNFENIIARFRNDQLALLTRFGNTGYLLNIANLWENISKLTSELRELGLDFNQYRAVLEAIYNQTKNFVDTYFYKYTHPNACKDPQRPIDYVAISERFSQEQAALINNVLGKFDDKNCELLHAQQPEQQDADFATTYEALQKFKDEPNFWSFSPLYTAIKHALSDLEPQAVKLKHMRLLRAVKSCQELSCVNTDDLEKRILSPFMTNTICNKNTHPYQSWYMAPKDSIGDLNPIFAAIEEGKKVAVIKELTNGHSPLRYNTKLYTALACALQQGNSSIINVVKDKVKNLTIGTLKRFNQDNGFRDLHSANLAGLTPMQRAIKDGNFEVVQALLIRDVFPSESDCALASKGTSTAAKVIFNDLSTAFCGRSLLIEEELSASQGRKASIGV